MAIKTHNTKFNSTRNTMSKQRNISAFAITAGNLPRLFRRKTLPGKSIQKSPPDQHRLASFIS